MEEASIVKWGFTNYHLVIHNASEIIVPLGQDFYATRNCDCLIRCREVSLALFSLGRDDQMLNWDFPNSYRVDHLSAVLRLITIPAN